MEHKKRVLRGNHTRIDPDMERMIPEHADDYFPLTDFQMNATRNGDPTTNAQNASDARDFCIENKK